jgi:hypothetical protein
MRREREEKEKEGKSPFRDIMFSFLHSGKSSEKKSRLAYRCLV